MTDYITGVEYSDAEIQQYITEQNIIQYLNDGAIALAKERPAKPLLWLGQWLLSHNKRKPVLEIPEKEKEKAEAVIGK
ncbi:Dpy-30 motif-containing protein [Giardia muris]|uniref:Dpy-30 motif-containing protein n=1 Tax=Giardia muris TaxID=5742 RepID=A0A4Z1TBS2_GIAMU|nr:Dpy-30 motif-containing protein [Giardia muris]|eukprot:TNJ29979.1 Dpy-30 motif-containing protein [Giardia muris]